MELTNNTPIPAKLMISEYAGFPHRIGILVAKATFSWDSKGQTHLDSQTPVPIFEDDQWTDLGILPRDNLPRRDSAFEVIILGIARAPGGVPTSTMQVAVSVGAEKRSILVFGDRQWHSIDNVMQISSPEPFQQIPLTYQRAFGGSCEVELDRGAIMDIQDPINPLGRGFDPSIYVDSIVTNVRPLPGYPKYDRTRYLPNLEYEKQRIVNWQDRPTPAYWAAVPLSSGFHSMRSIKSQSEQQNSGDFIAAPEMFHRAHPEWIIQTPPAASQVVMSGLSSEGNMRFYLPRIRMFVDYVLDQRTSAQELMPHMLVLLPEERRFYLVFRLAFAYDFMPATERLMRLRKEEGWFGEEMQRNQ